MLQKCRSLSVRILGDLRIAAFALVLTVGGALALPSPAIGASCAPGSEPTTGCNCNPYTGYGGTLFVPCGCCYSQESGETHCLYCTQE